MTENWKTQLNKKKKVGVIIMDLSKAFGTLNHNLLAAKLKKLAVLIQTLLQVDTKVVKLGTRSVNEK